MQISQPEFHRQLRTLFATLRILVRATEGRSSVEDYAAHLEGRVGTLARVHEMMMRAPVEGVSLEELVCSEFLSQSADERRYFIGGPGVRIGRDAAVPLGLAVHELANNAMAFGAFAADTGTVDVSWDVDSADDGEWLSVSWRERGVERDGNEEVIRGFGHELLERMLPYELNARTGIEFTPEGVCARIDLPALPETRLWTVEGEN